jgi:hypothetical protein
VSNWPCSPLAAANKLGRAGKIIRRMAKALVGRDVTVRIGTETTQGVVTNVLLKAGWPKIMVGGSEYCLGQVLTVTPHDSGRADCCRSGCDVCNRDVGLPRD